MSVGPDKMHPSVLRELVEANSQFQWRNNSFHWLSSLRLPEGQVRSCIPGKRETFCPVAWSLYSHSIPHHYPQMTYGAVHQSHFWDAAARLATFTERQQCQQQSDSFHPPTPFTHLLPGCQGTVEKLGNAHCCCLPWLIPASHRPQKYLIYPKPTPLAPAFLLLVCLATCAPQPVPIPTISLLLLLPLPAALTSPPPASTYSSLASPQPATS